jgi:hypothetical protein
MTPARTSPHRPIATLKEGPLHAGLKRWYAREGDRHEPGRVRHRRGWVIVERRLVGVVESRFFGDERDLLQLLPAGLPTPFTTADLDVARDLAQKMAYCLREAGTIHVEGSAATRACTASPRDSRLPFARRARELRDA